MSEIFVVLLVGLACLMAHYALLAAMDHVIDRMLLLIAGAFVLLVIISYVRPITSLEYVGGAAVYIVWELVLHLVWLGYKRLSTKRDVKRARKEAAKK